MIVRRFRKGDREAVVRLMALLQEHERALEADRVPGPRMARRYVERLLRVARKCRGEVLVAEREGRVVGFVAFWRMLGEEPDLVMKRPTGYVSDLSVLPEARRRGVATALMREAERVLRRRGARQVIVGVLDANAGARSLYRALGYGPYARLVRRRV